jgi:hypothetical protein
VEEQRHSLVWLSSAHFQCGISLSSSLPPSEIHPLFSHCECGKPLFTHTTPVVCVSIYVEFQKIRHILLNIHSSV